MLGEKGSFTPFLFWLENLNLRGGFKASIMDYIKSHYPHLIPLYEKIYLHKDRTYCKQLEQETAKWRRRLNASMWTIKNTHILQKRSTSVRHRQLVINDYCQNDR